MNKLLTKITGDSSFNLGNWLLDHIVSIIFWVFIILGLLVSKNLQLNVFVSELCDRFYRNAFLILSLIIRPEEWERRA